MAAPDAAFSRGVADEVAAAVDAGARVVTVWAAAGFDAGAVGAGAFARLARRAADRGAGVRLVVVADALDALDPAARLALRDAAATAPFALHRGDAPTGANGARAVAAADGVRPTIWASRDAGAGRPGPDWGVGADAPVVRFAGAAPDLGDPLDLGALLPRPGTQFKEVTTELDGVLAGFGARLVAFLRPELELIGAWRPGALRRIAYGDRYLHSPLAVRLALDAAAALRDALAPGAAIEFAVATDPLRGNDRQPFAPTHNWQWADERAAVFGDLAARRDLALTLDERGAPHGRVMRLSFEDGADVRLVLDQGFGAWETPRYARFDFTAGERAQAAQLHALSVVIAARGRSYMVVTR